MDIPEINFDIVSEPVESEVESLRDGYVCWGSVIVKIESANDTTFAPAPHCSLV